MNAPLRPLPKPLDDFEATMTFLEHKQQTIPHFQLRLMRKWEPLHLL